MIPQLTVAYVHQQIPLEKLSTQLSTLSEQMHHRLVISTALRFKLVKNMIHATKKKQKQKTITWFARRKVSSCTLCVALNMYANIRLHHHIISTAASSQGKTANRKVPSLLHLLHHVICKRLIFFLLFD